MRRTLAVTLTLLLASFAFAQPPTSQLNPDQPVRTKHAMVVSIHHLATDAGVSVLKEGGNAIDAAVATGFALAVVHPVAGNIGGGGFMLIHFAAGPDAGKNTFIDYRERAPLAATVNMYLDANGNIIPDASITGYKAIGVPGSVAGMVYAEKKYTIADGQFSASGRRSIIRAGEGKAIETQNYSHLYPAWELLDKRIIPIVAELHAHSLEEFGELIRHPGEEYAFVLEGEVDLHTSLYAPVRLKAGDSMYFDSGMGHAYIAACEGPCRVLSLCTAPERQLIAASAGRPRAEHPRKAPAPPRKSRR